MPSTITWKGDLAAVAQVDKFTPANVEIGDSFILTCNSRTVTFVATAATVANVTAGLTAAWNLSTQAEHAELTAADVTTYMTLTADTLGKPFTVTSSTVNGGAAATETLTKAAVTANQGPNCGLAGNFSGGVLPATGDTLILENSSVDWLYNLDLSAVTLALLVIRQSYTGKVGLPITNESDYVEYRGTDLQVGATIVRIGEGEGSGSSRIKLNTGAVQTTLNIYNQGGRSETGVPSLLWKGTHAANVVNLQRGDLGIAFLGGAVATVATINVGWLDSRETDAQLVCGLGCTLTTVNVYGGTVELNSATTTLNQTSGDVTFRGTGAITTWTMDGGTAYYCSSGTITTLNVGNGAVGDFRRDLQLRTITNCVVYAGGEIHDPNKTVTWTNGVDLFRRSLRTEDGVIDLGDHITVTPSAI